MKKWTLDQIILAPGDAKKDLELRQAELEVLRAENEMLREGINEIPNMSGASNGIKTMCRTLLNKGGA